MIVVNLFERLLFYIEVQIVDGHSFQWVNRVTPASQARNIRHPRSMFVVGEFKHDFLTLRQVWNGDIFYVEEYSFVDGLALDKAIAPCVVEKVDTAPVFRMARITWGVSVGFVPAVAERRQYRCPWSSEPVFDFD